LLLVVGLINLATITSTAVSVEYSWQIKGLILSIWLMINFFHAAWFDEWWAKLIFSVILCGTVC